MDRATPMSFIRYLQPTFFIDADHPSVIDFARGQTRGAKQLHQRAIRLFYAVRETISYDVLSRTDLSAGQFKASVVLDRGFGFCIDKAILLAAAGRAVEVPTRLHFADIVSHKNSPRLQELMGADLFLYHGYVEFYLYGRWVKAAPVFDLQTCHKRGFKPVEFDGVHHALLHRRDLKGRPHIDYVNDHGTFADFPRDRIVEAFERAYPKMYKPPPRPSPGGGG